MINTPHRPPPSTEKIFCQLKCMLNSPEFCASAQQTALLKFIVAQTLAGNAGEINDHAVATGVFGRGPDFNQRIDPVVSIQASLLRRSLERYYSTSGKHDPIRIILPEDTYVPVFQGRPHA